MSAVNPIEALRYGFELMVYLIGVNVVGGIIGVVGYGILFAGIATANDSLAVGGILGLLGFVVFMLGYATVLAGYLGIGYKVIADGVSKGIN